MGSEGGIAGFAGAGMWRMQEGRRVSGITDGLNSDREGVALDRAGKPWQKQAWGRG